MAFIEKIENLDYNLFRIVNETNSPFLDDVMWWISDKLIWIPLYISLIVLLYFRFKQVKPFAVALLCTVTAIALADLISVHAFKEVFQRFRPTHNTELADLVHTVNNYRGGQFGFVSSHAANFFAIALATGTILKPKFNWVLPILVIIASLVSYSRVYLGVHYPADVVCGGLLGGILGFGFAKLAQFIIAKTNKN